MCRVESGRGHGLYAIRRQAVERLAVVAPGGVEHGALDTVLAHPVAYSVAAELFVGEASGPPPGSSCV